MNLRKKSKCNCVASLKGSPEGTPHSTTCPEFKEEKCTCHAGGDRGHLSFCPKYTPLEQPKEQTHVKNPAPLLPRFDEIRPSLCKCKAVDLPGRAHLSFCPEYKPAEQPAAPKEESKDAFIDSLVEDFIKGIKDGASLMVETPSTLRGVSGPALPPFIGAGLPVPRIIDGNFIGDLLIGAFDLLEGQTGKAASARRLLGLALDEIAPRKLPSLG